MGVSGTQAEIEVLQYINEVMSELKAPKETYELRLNSRYLLDYLSDTVLNINIETKDKLNKALDSYLKMPRGEFNEYLSEIGLILNR